MRVQEEKGGQPWRRARSRLSRLRSSRTSSSKLAPRFREYRNLGASYESGKMRLKSGVDYFISSDGHRLVIYPIFGSFQYQVSAPFQKQKKILDCLSRGYDVRKEDVLSLATDDAKTLSFIEQLVEEGLVVDGPYLCVLSKHDAEKYKRQISYFEQSVSFQGNPEDLQRSLEAKCVAIIGCGGAGAPVCELLAASGVGRFRLIDRDSVELSNLGRQIAYTEADLGCKKVSALAKRIRLINPSACVEEVPEYMGELNYMDLTADIDLAILAADSPMPNILNWMDSASKAHDISFACISNSPPEIRVGPIADFKLGHPYGAYRNALRASWNDVDDYEMVASSFERNKAVTPWSCYAASSILVGQCIQWMLTGSSKLFGRSVVVNLETLEISERADCPCP